MGQAAGEWIWFNGSVGLPLSRSLLRTASTCLSPLYRSYPAIELSVLLVLPRIFEGGGAEAGGVGQNNQTAVIPMILAAPFCPTSRPRSRLPARKPKPLLPGGDRVRREDVRFFYDGRGRGGGLWNVEIYRIPGWHADAPRRNALYYCCYTAHLTPRFPALAGKRGGEVRQLPMK